MTKRHRADLRVMAEGGSEWAKQKLVDDVRGRWARREQARRFAVELLGAVALVVIGYVITVLAIEVGR